MLHWFYLFSFFCFVLIISLAFLNKNLLSLLLVSEIILIIFFLIGLLLGSCYNIYYVMVFSFLVLVLGALELALNILLVLL